MRYFVRHKIIELLSTFVEAIHYIKNNNNKEIFTIILDLQNGLESLRHTFKDSLTQDTYEKYNLLISQIEDKLIEVENKKSQKLKVNKETKSIKETLIELQENLKKEPEVKLEILFIPYKYSMWDSLESIWVAAKDDPRCNARVMPIPYYDRDENGLFSNFHYEIEEFIKNDIPVVSYKEYDYTVIRPDVIYFHNPYDGDNRVTSVSPEFYTDNLKHYTDMLIYIPYFLSIPYANISETIGLCQNKGVKNATKIILQSDEVKRYYVENQVNEDKLEVLGSPKLDAVLNRVTDTTLPIKWRNMANKKVFLYNSSISSLLNTREYLVRLKEHFNLLLDHPESSLLWRPHPLLEATIMSMKPELHDLYKSIKKIVRDRDNGYIDESEDSAYAFSISHALISDRSSLIPEYILTEKPVYIVDIESRATENTFISSDIYSCYFQDEMSLEEFMDLVFTDNDIKKNDRISHFSKSIVNSNGKSGSEIHRFIFNYFNEKFMP